MEKRPGGNFKIVSEIRAPFDSPDPGASEMESPLMGEMSGSSPDNGRKVGLWGFLFGKENLIILVNIFN